MEHHHLCILVAHSYCGRGMLVFPKHICIWTDVNPSHIHVAQEEWHTASLVRPSSAWTYISRALERSERSLSWTRGCGIGVRTWGTCKQPLYLNGSFSCAGRTGSIGLRVEGSKKNVDVAAADHLHPWQQHWFGILFCKCELMLLFIPRRDVARALKKRFECALWKNSTEILHISHIAAVYILSTGRRSMPNERAGDCVTQQMYLGCYRHGYHFARQAVGQGWRSLK